jgi:hypothetical protein
VTFKTNSFHEVKRFGWEASIVLSTLWLFYCQKGDTSSLLEAIIAGQGIIGMGEDGSFVEPSQLPRLGN